MLFEATSRHGLSYAHTYFLRNKRVILLYKQTNMVYLITFFFFLIIHLLMDLSLCDRCCGINLQKLPSYKLNKRGAYSKQVVTSRRIVRNLNECKRFAISKKALAFNFVLRITLNGNTIKMSHHLRSDILKTNMCEILDCPEIHNSSLLTKDKNYLYYSMYPNDISSDKGTVVCVPKAGLFLLSRNHLNYTQAETFCQKLNGSLAHVISEERTSGLAKFLPHSIPRYVGLSNNDNEKIWKNTLGEPLSCFEYRAWGRGEPSYSRGCVAIVTSSNTHAVPFWKVIPCYVSLPFICEIFPRYR